jgi:hypothetical protein
MDKILFLLFKKIYSAAVASDMNGVKRFKNFL